MSDLDPAAVEADKMWAEIQRLRTERDEARASLERERKARKAVEAVNADEVLRKRTNLEARIGVSEMERDEAVARAERAEADLAVCREALEEIAGEDWVENALNPQGPAEAAREALSRLDHSSEEER